MITDTVSTAEDILYGRQRRSEGQDIVENAPQILIAEDPSQAPGPDDPIKQPLGPWDRLRSRRRDRQLKAFHRRCDRLDVPDDVRRRLLKMGGRPVIPDAYAGRKI